MVVLVVSVLSVSSLVMGNMAFKAGLGVKRWAALGFLLGPAAYPLLSTHKRFAMKRAQGRGSVSLKL